MSFYESTDEQLSGLLNEIKASSDVADWVDEKNPEDIPNWAFQVTGLYNNGFDPENLVNIFNKFDTVHYLHRFAANESFSTIHLVSEVQQQKLARIDFNEVFGNITTSTKEELTAKILSSPDKIVLITNVENQLMYYSGDPEAEPYAYDLKDEEWFDDNFLYQNPFLKAMGLMNKKVIFLMRNQTFFGNSLTWYFPVNISCRQGNFARPANDQEYIG